MLLAACEVKPPTVPTPLDTQVGRTFSLSGTVTDDTGAPVAAARVEAKGQAECHDTPYPPYLGGDVNPPPCYREETLGVAMTDERGFFTIGNLPAVYLTVIASKDGIVVTQGINVRADSSLSVTLPMNGGEASRRSAGRR